MCSVSKSNYSYRSSFILWLLEVFKDEPGKLAWCLCDSTINFYQSILQVPQISMIRISLRVVYAERFKPLIYNYLKKSIAQQSVRVQVLRDCFLDGNEMQAQFKSTAVILAALFATYILIEHHDAGNYSPPPQSNPHLQLFIRACYPLGHCYLE